MKDNTFNLLIVDDELELRRSLISVLDSALSEYKFHISEAEDGQQSIEKVQQENYDLILMDVRMPNMDGLAALKNIKQLSPKAMVVIMTAHSNLPDAVRAIKFGAYDYIEKPVSPTKLTEIVKKALDTQDLVSEVAHTAPALSTDTENKFIGDSKAMGKIFHLIHRLSHVDTTVLIMGENGTGKELVAKAIHFNSPRKHGEFVAINCAAIPSELMESELFGHEKGAFTGAHARRIGKFQQANNGTLFLDEIGELDFSLQSKLLRVLQEGTFIPVGGSREVKTNARVVSATNQNLEQMVLEGRFREDLLYRLNVLPIFMPPLRSRLEDVEPLLKYIINKFNKKMKRQIEGVTDEALLKIKSYQWPGNVRELENVIERAFIMEGSQWITLDSLPGKIQELSIDPASDKDLVQKYSGPLDFDRFKAITEKEFITEALKVNYGKINRTVMQANIPKNTLLRKIKKYGIDVKKIIKP